MVVQAERLLNVYTVVVLYLACCSRLSIFRFKTSSIEANLTNALSRQNIRVDVPCRFTIAISTESESMNTAAERLLGLLLSKFRSQKIFCLVSCV
jgi:hypothetical protein